MKNINLSIEGMSCGHCLNAVSKALGTLQGVQTESVQIGRASVRFDETVISPEAIAEAVSKAGYRATPVAVS